MKRIIFIFGVFFLFSSGAFAAKANLFSGIGFSAPNVNGVLNATNPSIGDIIFDTNTSSFAGYSATGATGWIGLGGSSSIAVPTMSICTVASCGSGGFNGSGTYTTPANVLYIRVRMVGAGGGGSGGGNNGSAGGGGTGATTSFGASSCTGGATGTGGTALISGSGAIGTAVAGANAGFNAVAAAIGTYAPGGPGASSAFGGAGFGQPNAAGGAAIANTGSGGGGGGSNQITSVPDRFGGSGGGAGGFIDMIITSPAGSYSYAIGNGGSGGTAGTNGFAGAAGGSGYIEVTEYYQ